MSTALLTAAIAAARGRVECGYEARALRVDNEYIVEITMTMAV